MEHLRLQLLEASEQRQLKRERFVAGYLVQCSSVMHEIVGLLPLDSTRGNVDRRAGWTTKLRLGPGSPPSSNRGSNQDNSNIRNGIGFKLLILIRLNLIKLK